MSVNIDLACGALNKTAQRLAGELWTPLVESLTDAAESLASTHGTDFALSPMNPIRVVIALSGGRDSMAMLDLMARFFYGDHQYLVSRLRVIYVHHGLSESASAWEVHCERESRKRGLPFECIHVTVDKKQGGVEAAARLVRYRALEKSALEHGDDIVLTAHHEDDRLETFLLQLLRGAGPDGLAAFPETRQLRLPGSPRLGNERALLLLRPWANISRGLINQYAEAAKLLWVEDESNTDQTYARNRIRHEVMPLMGKHESFSHFKAGRSMCLTQDLVEGIHSVAQEDLAGVLVEDRPNTISIPKLLKLSRVRQKWCLRMLCQNSGALVPSQAKLEDTLRQIRETDRDTALCVSLDGQELRRWGDYLMVRSESAWTPPAEQLLYITHPAVIPLPEWNGELRVKLAAPEELGVPLSLMQEKPVLVKGRVGGEKVKLSVKRPTKALKEWFAEKGIPSFDRDRYPLLWIEGNLIFVGALGMNALCGKVASEEGEPLLNITFHVHSL